MINRLLKSSSYRIPRSGLVQILQCCSVVGERFSVWAASVVLDASPASIEETCDKLAQRQQFIQFVGIHEAANGVPSAHYEFRHALYRQALYHRLSSLNRSKLHLSLGKGLVNAGTGEKPELASELAMHFEEGRDYEQAARLLMRTAENDSRRFAHNDSIRVLQHALELAPLLPASTRPELEIQILQRIGDAHYALGAITDSAFAYEMAAARAAECGLRTAQIAALSRLALPTWYLDPERGNYICSQAIEVSRTHADPLLLARTQLTAACFRLLYDAWSEEDAQTCVSARQTICHLDASSMPEGVLYPYVLLIQGDYSEALKQAEAGMIAASSPAAYLLALGAKTLTLIGLGRFGELLRIIRTGRELARKNGEDPWVFIFREAWLRALCFDFEGVRRLSEIIMRTNAEQHASQPRTMAMLASGYAELDHGRCEQALQYFARVRDPKITPKFLFHWRWRMRAQLGTVEARLQAGDLENARAEVDEFLRSALSTGEPNLHAFAWEASARVAIAHRDDNRALRCIESALAVLDNFDIPVVAWRVHATAWDVYSYAGMHEKAQGHRTQAEEAVMRLADSFEPEEPLRASLLAAAPVQRILAGACQHDPADLCGIVLGKRNAKQAPRAVDSAHISPP